MNPYQLDDVLAEVNKVRQGRGLAHLTDLPNGIPGDPRECCLARALSGGRDGKEWAVVTGDGGSGLATWFVMFSTSEKTDLYLLFEPGCRGSEVPAMWSFQWAFDASGFPDLVDWPDDAESKRLCCATNIALDQDADTGETFMVCTSCSAVYSVDDYSPAPVHREEGKADG